jgi:hypothetical protein
VTRPPPVRRSVGREKSEYVVLVGGYRDTPWPNSSSRGRVRQHSGWVEAGLERSRNREPCCRGFTGITGLRLYQMPAHLSCWSGNFLRRESRNEQESDRSSFFVPFRVKGDWGQDWGLGGDFGGAGGAGFLSPLILFSTRLTAAMLRLTRKLFVTGSS